MTQIRIDQPPPADCEVGFVPGFGQRFLLTIDAEEEFDWSQPLGREGHSLDSVPRLHKFQQFCESIGVVPVYLADYPIATSPAAIEALRPAVTAGRAEIGIQLHPWVSPPHSEEVNQLNSFAGNLPADLERDKLLRLRDTIARAFDTAPQIYRAGRYGVGPNTARILSDAGIAIDTSVRARFNYSSGGGVDFSDHPLHPYWLDRSGGLMELPLTTVFWGPLRGLGPWLYPRLWRTARARGALSRLGLLERIPLTPEGVTDEEVIRAIDIAIDDAVPILVFSFHSPSLAPGYSPYVRSEEQLDAFYDWWRRAFAYLALRQVRPASVAEIMAAVALA